MKRILIIANKSWEAWPLMNALLEPKVWPPDLSWPQTLDQIGEWQQNPGRKTAAHVLTPQPRARYTYDRDVQAEIWCLQDWMDPGVSSSSTKEKAAVLLRLLGWNGGRTPSLVVAFGTAAFVSDESRNGCVVVGANAFIHDPFKADTTDAAHWHDTRTDGAVAPTVSPALFDPKSGVINESLRAEVETRFLPPPVNPARERVLLPAFNYTALSVVNITNYDDYAWADHEGVEAFERVQTNVQKKLPIGSIETTHSLIRFASDAPFLFISGITDRLGCFNYEVGSRSYSQNYAGAHNAGVTVAWLLPRLARFLSP